MGNVLSVCASEISNVFRNCRSQKSEDERKCMRNFEFKGQCSRADQRLDEGGIKFQHSSHSPSESRKELLGSYSSRLEDDWLPECDQSHGSLCPHSLGTTVDRDFPPEPMISKEYIIQTYRISKPEDHVVSAGKNKDCLQHDYADNDRQCEGSSVDIESLSQERSESDGIEEKAANMSDSVPLQKVENKVPHCSDFKPKKIGDNSAVQQKTIEEIATESYLSHLKWKKEMDAAESCVKKLTPKKEIHMKNLNKLTQDMSTNTGHSHVMQSYCKTVEISEKVKSQAVQTDLRGQCESHEVKSKQIKCDKTKSEREPDMLKHYSPPLASEEEKESIVMIDFFNPAKESPQQLRHSDTNWYSGTRNLSSISGNNHLTVQEKSGGEEQVPERIRKLEQRQERVLQELQKLQQSVQSLATERNVSLAAGVSPSSRTAVASGSQRSPLQNGKLHDLVINADPSSVPLSLLVLVKQLSKQFKVLVTTFVHSSATDTPEKLRHFVQNATPAEPRCNYQLAISVVWKKVPNLPSLMVSPTCQTCIKGEANIARYLSRLLQPAYDSDDINTATQIDEILDISQLQILTGNKKERSAAVRTLNARLGKGQWLVGSSLSLADVVAWSAVHEAKLAGDAPDNVKKWLKSCMQSELFQEALKFLPS